MPNPVAQADPSMMTAWLLGAAALAIAGSTGATARPCGPDEVAAIMAPAANADDFVIVACGLTLKPGDLVTKRLVIEGGGANGTALDCRGATLGRVEAQPSFPNATVEVRSVRRSRRGRTTWDRPTDIAIRHCRVLGPIRVWGMAANGQGEALKLSSRALGHTERAQAAAPRRVTIEDSHLHASGATPLYVAPGVTQFALKRSTISGVSNAIAVYLDAESARNALVDNRFAITTGREVVAVDGSAENVISGNTFRVAWQGGIHLYRNCGEGGTIRHQTPSRNVITGNRFIYDVPLHLPAIDVGSREGRRLYCGEDDGYPFGSSLDDGDGATDNVVDGNVVE